MRRILIATSIIVLVLIGYFIFNSFNKTDSLPPLPTPTPSSMGMDDHISSKKDLIVVESPRPLRMVTSPLNVSGKARGGWFFEATFPIVIVDWDGRIIGEGYATATDDWMSEEFVPFEGSIEFELPEVSQDFMKRGVIIFKKSNASGLNENDDALEIPVRFE